MSYNFELFHYWRSSCSWRVRWAMAIKKLPYKSTPINLLKNEHHTKEFNKLNPSGFLPTLLVNGKPLTESLAIIEWLEEMFPSPRILPTDTDSRVKVRELAYATALAIQPIQNLSVLNHISSDPKKRLEFARFFMERGLKALEKKLQQVAGTYCYGGEITLADLCLVPQVYNALRFSLDMNQYPTIFRIHNNCLNTKECEESAPHNQKGAIP